MQKLCKFLCLLPTTRGKSGNRVRREKAVVHSGGKPARELVRSTR